MSANVDGHYRPAPDVHTRAFDGETVVVDLQRGDYYALNRVGARLWEGLVAAQTPREIAATLQSELDVDPDRLMSDLMALVGELLERGLLISSADRP